MTRSRSILSDIKCSTCGTAYFFQVSLFNPIQLLVGVYYTVMTCLDMSVETSCILSALSGALFI